MQKRNQTANFRNSDFKNSENNAAFNFPYLEEIHELYKTFKP